MEFDYSRVFTLRVYWGTREKATLKRKERKKKWVGIVLVKRGRKRRKISKKKSENTKPEEILLSEGSFFSGLI